MSKILRIDNYGITKPLIDIVKDIKAACHDGKLAQIRQVGDNIRVCCVNSEHKGGLENKPSAGIYIGDSDETEYGWYRCFTCGVSCPFYHFVALAFECSDEKAKDWLIKNYADTQIEVSIDLPELTLTKTKTEYLSEDILKDFYNFHPYMNQRKLDQHILDIFEVKYDPKMEALVFPVRDENNNLVMLTRRSVNTKKFYIDEDKEKPLYLLNYIRSHNIDKVMITEGQIDALTACGFGFPCVATIGSISKHQINLLNNSGIRILYLCFDADEAGHRFTNKILSELSSDIIPIIVNIDIPGKKDINDLTEEEFYQCIQKAEQNDFI